MAFQLVTYGFLHDVHDLKHILFNCFGLWMFGRSVEARYGPKEYLAFFLAAVAVCRPGMARERVGRESATRADIRCSVHRAASPAC